MRFVSPLAFALSLVARLVRGATQYVFVSRLRGPGLGFVLGLLAAAAAQAQSVYWDAPDARAATTIQLVFENCVPEGDPQLPSIPGVTFTFAGRAESMSIVNFRASRVVRLTYIVRSRSNTPVQIPAFRVETDKGPMRVAAFTANAPAPALDTLATAKLVPERTMVWAGEVFGLTYELSASRRTLRNVEAFTWNAAPLVAEAWTKADITETVVSGEPRINWTTHTRALARTPNTLKLEAASQLLTIQTGTIGSFFGPQAQLEQVSVTSDQPMVEVKPLPAGAPAGFDGAVGDFTLTSKVVPETAGVGEPVTWTLELSGTGNWPDIAGLAAREVSRDFQVVQPKAKRTTPEGKIFDATLTEDVVLVPTKPGTYTLGPTRFTYFDPKSGTYQTKTTPATTLTITPPPAPQFAPPIANAGNQKPPSGNAEPDAADAASGVRTPVSSAPLPAGIPRDPLPGAAVARVPLETSTLVWLLIAPFALLFGFWLLLAVRRAQQTDPVRPRREARQRLAKTLSHLQTAPEQERPSLLLAWQRDTAVLWQLWQAAPRADALSDPLWANLWAEADRALYGPKTALPSDWVARAQEALAAKRLPGFQPLRLFRPQNLWPFAAVLAFLLLAPCTLLLAAATEEGVAAYQKGEFTRAEKTWRDRIAATPTDWIARHNLSLALEQQDRASEAAAHAAVAFVQKPAHPAVRWHFTHTAERLNAAPAVLSGFLTAEPQQAIGRAFSPADWQRLMILEAWCAALMIGMLVANAYGRRKRVVTWIAASLLTVAVVLFGIGMVGVKSYGIAADGNAAVVARSGLLRSIPTEADLTQKTSPLSAGAMGIVDKTFLGWRRLAFENGQTGWVRAEEIVPLWK